MSNLKYNGYYLSPPRHYEDWHAGLKIEHYNFIAYFFSDNSKVYKTAKTNDNIFSKTDFINDSLEIDYSITDKTIDFHYDKGSEFEYHSIFHIHDTNTIVDKKSVKYTWTGFPTEKTDSEPPSSVQIDS